MENFVHSKIFYRFSNLPISLFRSLSYLENPRAASDDVVLCFATENSEIVAYRTLLPDFCFLGEKIEKFAWISGSWTQPNFRRQGISKELLKVALESWDEKLMFTNFAPESQKLYENSGKFLKIKTLNGKRFYFRFVFSEVLPPRFPFLKKISPVLSATDFILNFFNNFYFLLKDFFTQKPNFHFEFVNNFDNELKNFVKSQNENELFKRSISEFQWIKNFQWVISSPFKDSLQEKYYFSSFAKKFFYYFVKIRNEKNELTAFLFISLKNNRLTLPYVYFLEESKQLIVDFLFYVALKTRISIFTVYQISLIKEFSAQKSGAIFSKNISQTFYASEKLASQMNDFSVQDGDGDCVFT